MSRRQILQQVTEQGPFPRTTLETGRKAKDNPAPPHRAPKLIASCGGAEGVLKEAGFRPGVVHYSLGCSLSAARRK